MKLLSLLRNLRRKALTAVTESPDQGVDRPTVPAELLIDGDHDMRKLARFCVEARLVKQVPIDRNHPPGSWYGGKPQMPDYLAWPVAKGKPMVFVGQIDCSDLPRDLWGGVGPRSGWLLVFLAPSYPKAPGNSDLPVRVIHTAELGAERSPPEIPEVEWLFTNTRQASPFGAAHTFPKWPVEMHGKAFDAPESSKRFDRNIGSHDGARPNPNGLPWPGGLAGNPLTPAGLKMLYDSLIKGLEGTIKGAETLVSDFTKVLDQNENQDDTQPQSALIAEEVGHHRDRSSRGRPKLEATIPVNIAALAQLRALMQRHPVEHCPDLLSTQDWEPIATELDRITTAEYRWTTTRWSNMAYKGEVYRDESFELVRPDTVGELRDSLTAIILAISAIEKKLKGRIVGREGLLQRNAALSPEARAAVSDRRRFELDHAARTLETAKSHHKRAREAWTTLINLRGKVQLGGDEMGPVPDQIWGTALEVTTGTVVTDFDLEELLPEITAREEILVEPGTLLKSDRNRASGLRSVEAYRHVTASTLYADDADLLPHEVRAHFEPIWASAAMDSHDGMGGLPRWDSVDNRYFNPALFMAPDGRERFLKENRYWSLARAPFDRDNALLLQLFSDPLMGWMWGDVSHLVLLVPRDDLAKSKFDNVIAITSG